MKKVKKNLLKTLLTGVAVGTITTATVLNLSSCAYSSYYFDCLTFKNGYNAQSIRNVVETKKIKWDSLLFGNTKINKGNYAIITGSNAFESTTNLFTNGKSGVTMKKLWYTDEFYPQSSIAKAFEIAQSSKNNIQENFTIFFFIDEFINENNLEGRKVTIGYKDEFINDGLYTSSTDVKDAVGPFDVWTEEMIESTLNHYSKSFDYCKQFKKKIKVNTFIRQDASAKAYRDMICRTQLLFPVTPSKLSANLFDEAEKRSSTVNASNNNSETDILYFDHGVCKKDGIAQLTYTSAPKSISERLTKYYTTDKLDQ